MALYEFLATNRTEILERVKTRIGGTAKGTGEQSISSLPELYEDLIATLRADVGLPRETGPIAPDKSAARHGLERLQIGFSIAELVNDYGALCNAITELAEKDQTITPHEYQILNEVLDVAIAEAVTGYANEQDAERDRAADRSATEHLEFVAHELRTAISSAILSFDAIRKGQVSIGGRTSSVLEDSLVRLRGLIDRSLAEVRLKSGGENNQS